jgi:hypothetical protein
MALTSLPTELIEHIATYLDLKTSRSFRLASSSLSKQTSHLFRDRFFRKRSVEWTMESLETLQAVANHELFSDALRDMVIDATPTHSTHLWALQLRISEAQAISTPYGTVSADPELNNQYRSDAKKAEKEATFFNETRYDQKCLKACFEKLGRLDSITFQYEGISQEYARFCKRYCERSQHEMSRPFVSTMAAVASTKLQVGQISLDKQYKYGAISIGRLESLAPKLRDFDYAFEGLETLQLNLRDWRPVDEGFELPASTRAPFIVRFLARARNVETLDLSCYSLLEPNLFSEMAIHCHFERLETCKLSDLQIPTASSFLAFFAHPSSTLRQLSLHHVLLADVDVTWPDLLRSLADDASVLCRLEDLHVEDLFSSEGQTVWIDGSWKRRFGQTGQVGSWRHEAFQDFNNRWGPSWSQGAVTYPFKGLR